MHFARNVESAAIYKGEEKKSAALWHALFALRLPQGSLLEFKERVVHLRKLTGEEHLI
jgi:hypothetical protein